MGNVLSLVGSGYKQSFMLPAPTLTEKNLPDQSGKVFIITGANAGVGYQVSNILYGLNGTVYVACRSESKAQTAISSIKSAHPNSTGKLVYLHLNLSDLTTIKATADEFLSKETRLDWLNNNAGVMVPPHGSRTTQNHELQIGTNVLGPYLLTKLLLPILKSTASSQPSSDKGTVRVSWAGSLAVDVGSPRGGVQFDEDDEPKRLELGDGYAQSKAANWFLAHEFARRHGARDGVLHNAYNPGNLKTELQRHVGESIAFGAVANFVLGLLLLYPAVFGAYTEIYAGLSRDLTIEHDQGGFVIPWGRRSTWNRADVVAEMKEGGASEKLWDWCERVTRQYS